MLILIKDNHRGLICKTVNEGYFKEVKKVNGLLSLIFRFSGKLKENRSKAICNRSEKLFQ
jgi:hypothetical protein